MNGGLRGRLRRDQRGATAIEYGLIAGLIALGIVGALVDTRGSLNGAFNGVAGGLGSGAGAAAPAVTPLKAVASSSRSSYWAKKTLASAPTTVTNGAVVTKTFSFTDGTKAVLKSGMGGNNDTSLVITDPSATQRQTMLADAQGRIFQYVLYQYYDTALTSPSRSDFLDNHGSSMGAPPIADQDNWSMYDTGGNTTTRSTYYQSQIDPTVNAAMANQYHDFKYFTQQ